MSLPVLIYISKDSCPACKSFNQREWENVKYRLNGKVRFVSFRMKDGQRVPPCIEKYADWFPNIILTSARNYNEYFTSDNECHLSKPGSLSALQFNSVEEDGVRKPAGRPYTADAIEAWFQKAVKKL